MHAPIVGALAVASANWPWPLLLKFAVVSSGGVLASFVVATMLLRLPGVRRHIAAGITGVLNARSPTPGSQDLEDHRLLEDRREDLAIPGDTAPAVLHVNFEDALEHLFVTPVG